MCLLQNYFGRYLVTSHKIYHLTELKNKSQFRRISGDELTSNVSEPPTMLRPSPSLSLFTSMVLSRPGAIAAVAGSAGGSSASLPDGEGEIPVAVGFFTASPVKYCHPHNLNNVKRFAQCIIIEQNMEGYYLFQYYLPKLLI